jgi:hypothetical protein
MEEKTASPRERPQNALTGAIRGSWKNSLPRSSAPGTPTLALRGGGTAGMRADRGKRSRTTGAGKTRSPAAPTAPPRELPPLPSGAHGWNASEARWWDLNDCTRKDLDWRWLADGAQLEVADGWWWPAADSRARVEAVGDRL